MHRQLAESQKLDALGQLTGGVAHDFNNLLMVISGSLHILRKSIGDDPKSQRALAAIDGATKRGASLTSQLLTFARRQSVNPQAVDIGQHIDAVRGVLDVGVGGAVTLRFDIARDVGPVMVDVAEFETALVNLVINARDAMTDGGVITISARNDTIRRRLCRDVGGRHRRRHRARRPQQDLRSLLHHQADRQGHRPRAVAGSRFCAPGRRHGQGGERTRPGHHDHDPAAATETAPATAKVKIADVSGSGTVLLVEDNPDVAIVSAGLLEQLGYTVRRVANAEAALRELERDGIDLVFSDIVMPGKMDGLGLARHLREVRPGLPILLTTGYSDAALNVRGDFPILRKPYEIHELSQAIAKLPR